LLLLLLLLQETLLNSLYSLDTKGKRYIVGWTNNLFQKFKKIIYNAFI